MESVENLMIGKETALLVMISKALMNGLVYRGKTDLITLQFLHFQRYPSVVAAASGYLPIYIRCSPGADNPPESGQARLKFLWNSGCGAISKAMRAWLSPLAVNRCSCFLATSPSDCLQIQYARAQPALAENLKRKRDSAQPSSPF